MLKSLNLQMQRVRNIVDYLFVYLLISLSGNQVFGETALIVTFLLSILLFLYRKEQLNRSYIYFIFILITILLLQTVKFDFYPWVTMSGVIIRISLAYFIIKSIGETFIDKYINTMIVISLVSTVVYFAINLIPGLSNYLINTFTLYVIRPDDEYSNIRYFFGFYTIVISPTDLSHTLIRNHGPFWEAGVMGGYVMLAMIFNALKTGQIFNKAGLFLMIVLLTTISTTAVLAAFIFVFFYLLAIKKHKLLKWIMVPIIIITGYVSFFSLDFLGDKIMYRLELAQQSSEVNSDRSSRFLDVVRDWKDFQGHEIIGRGVHSETRFGKTTKMSGLTARTNGITDHLLRYGSVFLIITFFLIYKSQLAVLRHYRHLNKIFAIGTTIVIFILLQSEPYFNYPFFWGLTFLYIIYINNEEKEDDALYRNT
ncbi:MAG: hypothetical protein WBF77_12665, partial [Sulfurimonadaceae bacterium]